MKKIYFISLIFLFISCQQDQRMVSIKKVSFETNIDIYQEGFSDAENLFLFFTTSDDNMLYKYYLNKKVKETIDLKKEMKIGGLNRYFVIFNKENYIVSYQSVKVYNSATNTVYDLDSLTNYNGMEYAIVDNNLNSLKDDKLILSNLFTCELYNKQMTDVNETIIACEQLNKKKPSYSILDFKNSKVELSSITFKDIKPETKNNTSEPWFKASAIYINNDILYNNHFTNGVFKIDSLGRLKKVIIIKSKYTKFQNTELFKKDDITT